MVPSKYKAYFSNAGMYLSASLISSALSVIINPFVAMNMSPEDYGIVGFYTAFNTLFTPIIGYFIIDYYLRRYYQYSQQQREESKGTIIKLYLFFSGTVCLCSLGGLWFYVKIKHIELPFFPYALLAILQLYFAQLYNFKLAEYRIAGRGKSFFRLSVLYGLTNVILTILFIVILKLGAFGRLFSSMLLSLTFFSICLIKYKTYLKYRFDIKTAKDLYKYSTPLVFAGLLGFFGNGYDKVLLEQHVELAELGIYTVGFQIAAYLDIFSTSIKSTFQPDIYKALADSNYRKLIKIMLLTILFVSAIVVLFILVCPLLIRILTAGRYMESVDYVRILSLSVITSTIYYQISQITYGSGLSNLTFINKIIGTALTILTLTIFVSKFGAYGAAWGVVLSFVIYAIGNITLLFIFKNKFLNANSQNKPN